MTELPPSQRDLAAQLFGERLPLAERFTAMLEEQGEERGLIGPREVDRLWERHVLNCALMSRAVDPTVRTLADVGSGAGLPGVVLAIARPDLEITLIETMQRRCQWLEEVDQELGLGLEVVRARAEELHGQRTFDVVTARAVAALDKLAKWTLPLVAVGGELVAMKGSSAADEIAKAEKTLTRLGGADARIELHGDAAVEVPTTVVRVRKQAPRGGSAGARTQTTRKGGRRG